MNNQALDTAHIIPFVDTEFDYDSTISKVSTSDLVNLFMSISPEFGEGTLSFAFDKETNSIWLDMPGVSSQISIADIDPFKTWDAAGESDVIAIRALIKNSKVSANTLSQHHSFTKFFSDGETIIAEEPIYLTHGVSMMNMLDRIVAFIETINTANS